MKTGRQIYFLILFSTTLVSGCSPSGDYKPWLIGDIYGRVNTFNEFGHVDENFSGVIVTAYGIKMNYIGATNASGEFKIPAVPNGTYDLSFEKKGYGTLKLISMQHLGGTATVLNDIYFLYRIPDSRTKEMTIRNDTLSVSLENSGNDSSDKLLLQVSFSGTPGFDPEHPDFKLYYSLYLSKGKFIASTQYYNINWNPNNYYSLYYRPGQTVYIRARIFTSVPGGVDTYYDYDLKQTIYPNLGKPSDEFTFVNK